MIILAISPAFAVTHDVPAEYATIQSGLDVSASGDTVLVQPGTYFENLIWPQVNGINLIASGDTSNTIIDGNQVGRVITMTSEGLIDTTTLIQGFTIRNGLAEEYPDISGGGIYCLESSPTISECSISGNTAGDLGGGICCEEASPMINNCTISGNSVDHAGGGICCYQASSPIISNCYVIGNSAIHGGGIKCLSSSSPTISNCIVDGNSASQGGGINCYRSSNPSISDCYVIGNSASVGGGIYCNLSSPTITDCTISDNLESQQGGGICCHTASNPTVSNCVINGNSAISGGGIYCSGGSSPSISNGTIRGNLALHEGGGIYSSSGTTISNCAVTDNTGEGIYIESGNNNPEIFYSDFYNNSEGNFGGPDVDPDFGVIVGTNANGDPCDAYFNIYLNPRYIDPDNGDYHLQEDSPCIDAGDPDNPLDPDGTIADIGAFFYDHDLFVADFSNTELPDSYTISPAYPNPFNPTTTVSVSLPHPAELNVSVFNVNGQHVATLANGQFNAGSHNLTFDASNLAGGVYFVRASAYDRIDVQKVVLMK
jgi:parallel beta-helix repeat protein/predicted outer membrane repeat protein